VRQFKALTEITASLLVLFTNNKTE
jgi:hypothetical protein